MTVNDVPAVCHNLTCDFSYIEPVGQVIGHAYNHVSKKLKLEGESLPNMTANISSVYFAHTHCTIDESTLSDTYLECTLDEEPTCGYHLPILTSNLGVVPNAEGLISEELNCTLTDILSASSINLLGGDNITFSGTMLPKDLSTSNVTIKFNDTKQTSCIPQISSSNELVCLTGAFD